MRSSINLFSTRASIPLWIVSLDPYIVLIRVLCVSLVIAAAILYGVALGFISIQEASVASAKEKAIAQITSLKTKEMKYMIVKERLPIVESILKTQKSLAPYIDTAMAIAAPPLLRSISPGEKQQVSLQIQLPSIEDGVPLLEKIIGLANENAIRSPSLSTVSVSAEGIITVGVSYTVRL